MKKLILAVMLSVLLCGFGTAYAVLGVEDAVPGQDVVFPVICQVGGGLDTLWAIAEKDDGGHFADNNFVTTAHLILFDRTSIPVYDEFVNWTKRDIWTDLCSGVVSRVQDDLKPELIVTIGGKQYYVGYIAYFQTDDGTVGEPDIVPGVIPAVAVLSDRFIPWVYLVDLNKGFASGFNGVTAEYGLGEFLGEAQDQAPVTAVDFFPRYFFMNNGPETWNWWIFLAGRNELAILNPTSYGTIHRFLTGVVCDEQENCPSLNIAIPYELNIVNVLGIIPNSLKTTNNFPANSLGGFALLTVQETGTIFGIPPIPVTIIGTVNSPFVFSPVNPLYSMYGWSYQREGSLAGAALSWDVIHVVHRTYIDLGGTTLTACVPCNPNTSEECDPFVRQPEICTPLTYITGDTTAEVEFTTNAD